MKIVNALAVLISFVAATAATGAWELYASYPTPGPNPRGYWGIGPEAGYIVMDGGDPYVYLYSWTRGSIAWSFPAPGGPGAWGIYYYGATFYITNNRTSWIYETTKQGSVISSFRCPFDGPADLSHKYLLPSGLQVAIRDRNIIAVLDYTTGSLLATYPGPGARPTGAWGYAHAYVSDTATHTVYEDGVPVITGIQTPVGLSGTTLTAPPYDIKLFVIDDATDYYYYYGRESGAVPPASLGRVKALFK
jgi:hypothetical protein